MRDGTLVALKFFRPGSTYDGAIQRERYILDTFVQVQANMASRRMNTKTANLRLESDPSLKTYVTKYFKHSHSLVFSHIVTQLVGNGNKSVCP